jgi:hypothetical protein
MTKKNEDQPDTTDEHAERGPWIRLDDVHLSEQEDGTGYEVVIEGVNLRSAVVPPRVTVGGLPLEEQSVSPDGRSIRGQLRKKPDSLHVVVDYGFARDELPH